MSKIDDGMSLNDSIHTDEDQEENSILKTEDSSLMMKTGPGGLSIGEVSSDAK